MTSTIKVDTISEKTSANGVTIDGLTIKDGGITATTGAIVFNEASADLDFRIEGNGDANAFFLDGEVDRIYLGHNADTDINGLNARLQISGTDFDKSSASLIRYSADANPPSIGFAKSRNASIAGNTIVQDGDNLGRIRFAGADGGDFANVAGQIDCQVDGTPGVNDMPGRLIFSTGADGATSATERVRIHSGGVMSASQGIALGVGTANTASNVLDDYEEGTFTPSFSGASGAPSGVNYSYRTGSYTKIGRLVTCHIYLALSSWSSGPSGDMIVTSLPFTCRNNTDSYAAANVGYCDGFTSSDAPQTGYVPINNTKINMQTNQSSDGRDDLRTPANSGNMSGDETIIISTSYHTDA
jgi:hypothetical protein